MIYKLFFEKPFHKNIEKFTLKERALIFRKIDFLKNDPEHPSLRVEKLHRDRDIWACSVTMGIRLIWQLRGDRIFINNVGRHDILRKYG